MKENNRVRGYTDPISQIQPSDFYPLVDLAISEDSPQGDVTSEAIFQKDDKTVALLVSREDGVLAGIDILSALNSRLNHQLELEYYLEDGDILKPGQEIARITGSTRKILRMERILLNFLQYLSGIASKTHQLVTLYPGLRILDTRKTLPGYRKLAKYAVHTGGGWNHRINLSDMAMIKDNHIHALGSIQNAVASVRENNSSIKIELEIDSLTQIDEAIQADPEIILLDNFSIEETKIAIQKIQEKAPSIFIEVSGGITPSKLSALSKIGGIGVSMGYLTHTTRFLDIGLDIEED